MMTLEAIRDVLVRHQVWHGEVLVFDTPKAADEILAMHKLAINQLVDEMKPLVICLSKAAMDDDEKAMREAVKSWDTFAIIIAVLVVGIWAFLEGYVSTVDERLVLRERIRQCEKGCKP